MRERWQLKIERPRLGINTRTDFSEVFRSNAEAAAYQQDHPEWRAAEIVNIDEVGSRTEPS